MKVYTLRLSSSMKFTIEEIQEILVGRKLEMEKVNQISRDLAEMAKQKKEEAEEEKVPKERTEYTVVVLDEANVLPDGLTGFVVSHKADVDPATVVSRLCDAAKAHNLVGRGRKTPLQSMVEVFSHVKRKFVKEKNIQIKTKTLVRLVKSNNKIV